MLDERTDRVHQKVAQPPGSSWSHGPGPTGRWWWRNCGWPSVHIRKKHHLTFVSPVYSHTHAQLITCIWVKLSSILNLCVHTFISSFILVKFLTFISSFTLVKFLTFISSFLLVKFLFYSRVQLYGNAPCGINKLLQNWVELSAQGKGICPPFLWVICICCQQAWCN